MRKRIFEVIEVAAPGDRLSRVYDVGMILVILASMIPLTTKQTSPALISVEYAATSIFILDYLIRLCMADLKLGKGVRSFLLYPFTPMALIDLICILPTFSILGSGFRVLKVFRLFRALRVLKIFRYSRHIEILARVIRQQAQPLSAVCVLAISYVLISAIVIFNVEPDTFDNYYEAVYWATVSLTTMGYGDIYPVSAIGRLVTMVSSFIGIAIVALPSGIITAGYMKEIGVESRPAKAPSATVHVLRQQREEARKASEEGNKS